MNAIKLILIFSVFLVTSCAPPKLAPEFPAQNTPSAGGEAQKSIPGKIKTHANTISTWELSGAIAARNKKKGWTASLNWLQQGANKYQIRLFGPLGGGTVVIENDGGTVTYIDGPKKIMSHDADELLQKQTGIRLPVHDLYYWVRGLSAPGAVEASQYDQSAHLMSLTQAGYIIRYTNYTSVSNVDLPSKIQLEGHGVIIKLVIKRWKI